MTRVYGKETVETFLAPVAEAIADLLADGDFNFVRHCEGNACVLWFYDRTKGHRRSPPQAETKILKRQWMRAVPELVLSAGPV